VVIWLTLIIGGFYFIQAYNARPGQAAAAPEKWPQNKLISPATGESNLLVFLHPMCPCSKATIEELTDILAAHGKNIHPKFVIMTPDDADPAWNNSSLMQKVKAIPGGEIIHSPHGSLEKLFSVHTSGQILLYNPEGQLVFSGGITTARGERGENQGSIALTQALSHLPTQLLAQSPVFGCPLASPIPHKAQP